MSNILFSGANTGIGISPSYKLDVAGTTQVRGATGTNPATLILNPSGAGFVSQIESLATGAFTLNMTHNSVLGMSINSSGYVGVGTSAQANILQVGGGGRLRVANSDTDYTLIGTADTDGSTNTRVVVSGNTRGGGNAGRIDCVATASGSHYWFTGGVTQRMELNSSGNLGIGAAAGTVQRFRVATSGSVIYYANQFDGTITQNDSGADGGSQIGVFSGNTFAPTASCFLSAGHYIQSSMYSASTKSITHAAQLWINPIYSNVANLGSIFTAYGIRIDPGPAHAGTVNNGYGLFVSRPGFGTNKYTAYFDPIVGIGGTPNSAYSLFIAGTLTDTAGNFQIGNHIGPVFAPTNNTVNICAQYIYVTRNSSAGAVTNSFGLYIDNGGASGAAPTASYGLYVRTPGLGTTRYTAYFDSGVGINTTNTGATYPIIVGGQYASTTSAVVANTSDVRIKKDIAPITEGTESAIETVKKLNAKKYKYTDAYIADNPSIDPQKTYYGFVAQELEQVLPDCVITSDMKCYGGTKKEAEPTVVVDNIKFVDLQRVNMLLVEAIKELVGLVESLQTRVAALEARE